MSKLPVKNMQGESRGEVELPDELLVYDKGRQAVVDSVLAYRNALRAGTAATLTKGTVAGTGKKPWKQKGTGNARAGYRRSPVWRGGGVVFGPHPRDYSQKTNKKAGRLAFCRAFSEKVAAGQVVVLDQLTFEQPKTREVVNLLKKLDVRGPTLLVLDLAEKNITLSARNVPKLEIALGRNVNTYQLLRYPTVLITRPGLDQVQQRLQMRKGKSE